MATLDWIRLMPWGGSRNLALREHLGLVDGESGLVDMQRRVQLVVDTRRRAEELAGQLPGTEPHVSERSDGRFIVHAEAHD